MWYTCLKCGRRISDDVDWKHADTCKGEDAAPTKGIYKCPVHGLFVQNLDGKEVPAWIKCPSECMTLDATSNELVGVPCGLISNLAGTKDVDLDKKLDGLDDDTWNSLRDSISALRKKYAEITQEPGSMYGCRWNTAGESRLVGPSSEETKLKAQQTEDAKVAQDMFETIEREKMKMAMAQAGVE